MVRGLDVFREYFAGYADQFVLIGGTAATLAMEDAGLEFRATKDLDIVLHIEALNAAFGEVIWKLVGLGRYEIRRAPQGIKLAEGCHLSPIPRQGPFESALAVQVFPSAAVYGRYELYRAAFPSER